jgi:hypothetical protein
MNCCIECFRDSEIRAIINSFGKIGNCDFCPSKNVFVYDVSISPNPIADMIVSLLDTYAISESADAKLLKESLRDDWDIFNSGAEVIQMLTQRLCASDYLENDVLFTQNVIIAKIMDPDFLDQFCIVKGHSWQEFSDSIKYKNRFHSDMFCADAFNSFLQSVAKKYTVGTLFYRARISPNDSGFSSSEMSSPPRGSLSAGRINPAGISALYLSSDYETILHEVRATTYDYITIGEFRLQCDINAVNLSGFSNTSPFLYQGEIEKYAANRKVFQEIALELAKPLRRGDSPLEYLPTQYIAEFIKSQGYDGVEYASTLRQGGKNLAVFNEELFECVSVNTIEISKIVYETSPELSTASLASPS